MKIKICGLTSPEEAGYLNINHVDLAGMVLFFPKSKRNISISMAHEIMAALGSSISTVAVTVSPSSDEVAQIALAGFDYIQIHGRMPDGCSLPVLKAFNISDLDEYPQYMKMPGIAGYVFDASAPGSGKAFDWKLITDIPRDDRLFVLAGGLSSDNVSDAIAAVHPDCVDVSSGVEYKDRPGKDPERIAAFVSAVRHTE